MKQMKQMKVCLAMSIQPIKHQRLQLPTKPCRILALVGKLKGKKSKQQRDS